MSFGQYGGSLIDFNASGALAVGIINPLALQLDAALFGSLGLGALQANFQAQLQAALQASFDIGLNISNPYIGFQLALAGIAALQAQITAALSGAIPAVSIDATGQLAANAALVASLELQIGGLQALISGMLQLKLPAVKLAADFAASLALGPVYVLAWENEDMTAVKARIDTINGGVPLVGPSYGVLVVTQVTAAWSGLKFFFRTDL